MEIQTDQPTRIRKPILWESFLVGFASTCGMMAAFAAYQNRDRIRSAVKALLAQ